MFAEGQRQIVDEVLPAEHTQGQEGAFITGVDFDHLLVTVFRIGKISHPAIDTAKILIGDGEQPWVGGEAESCGVLGHSVRPARMFLEVGADIDVTEWIQRIDPRRILEMRQGGLRVPDREQRYPEVVFGHQVVFGDPQGVRPEIKAVLPIRNLTYR